jgi:hypothetical protein
LKIGGNFSVIEMAKCIFSDLLQARIQTKGNGKPLQCVRF